MPLRKSGGWWPGRGFDRAVLFAMVCNGRRPAWASAPAAGNTAPIYLGSPNTMAEHVGWFQPGSISLSFAFAIVIGAIIITGVYAMVRVRW